MRPSRLYTRIVRHDRAHHPFNIVGYCASCGNARTGCGEPHRARDRQQRLRERAAPQPRQRCEVDRRSADRSRIRCHRASQRRSDRHEAGHPGIRRASGEGRAGLGRPFLLRRSRRAAEWSQLSDPDHRAHRARRGRGDRSCQRRLGDRANALRAQSPQHRDPRRMPQQSFHAQHARSRSRIGDDGCARGNFDRLLNCPRRSGGRRQRSEQSVHPGSDEGHAPGARAGGADIQTRARRRHERHCRQAGAMGVLLAHRGLLFHEAEQDCSGDCRRTGFRPSAHTHSAADGCATRSARGGPIWLRRTG